MNLIDAEILALHLNVSLLGKEDIHNSPPIFVRMNKVYSDQGLVGC